jgi:DNA polymerase III delta prime subunit
MLSTGAFNALLKTLEEPTDNVVFVLATTELQKYQLPSLAVFKDLLSKQSRQEISASIWLKF